MTGLRSLAPTGRIVRRRSFPACELTFQSLTGHLALGLGQIESAAEYCAPPPESDRRSVSL
jgi:hypothetical protein